MALPPNIPKRGLNLAEAAEYCGISANTLLRHGPKPSKIGDRNVYDRHMLDRWLDREAAACGAADGEPRNLLREAINARKNAVRDPPAQ